MNYRPISLTCVTAKILKRIISQAISQYIDINNVFSGEQFGFWTSRSVEYQLLLTYNDVSECVDLGCSVDLILFDFLRLST